MHALLTDLFPDERTTPPSCFAHVYVGFSWVEFSSGAKSHVWTDVLISSQSTFNSKTILEAVQL